jgi:F0F1-type ATP synthase alpha subunit
MIVVHLTALPVVTNAKRDVSAYISTNVISITDWPNLFESDLFYSWYSTSN